MNLVDLDVHKRFVSVRYTNHDFIERLQILNLPKISPTLPRKITNLLLIFHRIRRRKKAVSLKKILDLSSFHEIFGKMSLNGCQNVTGQSFFGDSGSLNKKTPEHLSCKIGRFRVISDWRYQKIQKLSFSRIKDNLKKRVSDVYTLVFFSF